MTEPVILEFNGDCWNNPKTFQEQLNHHPLGEPLTLDLRSEGPSLGLLGVTHVIDNWLRDRSLTPDSVKLLRFSNPVEFLPYQKVSCSKISHFFFLVSGYWLHTEPALESQLGYNHVFGLFIGRLSLSRAVIFYKCLTDKLLNPFASRMRSAQPFFWTMPAGQSQSLENLSDWLPLNEQVRMFDWYNNDHVPSIDNRTVQDQFATPTAYRDTNASLLQHYHNFAVEIVCETYTLGNTFFPTEKTIRPIMAAKPMFVYAPRYYLARLRNLGFKTYHTLWDESYDLYQGPERWQLMRKSMNRLIECSRADQAVLLTQAHEIAQHNRTLLWEICNNRVDLFRYDYSAI